MTLQEIIREIPYLSVRERKILLKLIAESLGDPNGKYDLPDIDDAGAQAGEETEPQEYINHPDDD